MDSAEKILKELKKASSAGVKSIQEHFGVLNVNSYGLTTPQMRKIAKQIGMNHELALQLWKTGVHEARHIAIFIADPKQVTERLMEQWLKDFNSWDIVDNCCGTLFEKTPLAFDKAIEWTKRKKEFEKRAGFVMMAELAVHDKKSEDKKYEQFFPYLIAESHDERNFVKKAINWALRQIGKRNERLCKKAIVVAKQIQKKGDAASRWIASDALRELERYQKEGKIKKIGL
ncbi:MAG TPA: DNA alkylation repair protein [Chitinophagales bacterium]|nr:DNA alkylation repair protein [Chitinophagales bacterium]